MSANLLNIKQLYTRLSLEDGCCDVVGGVSLSLDRGATLALVGESGCGKTMTAYSIMRLLPVPLAKIVSGSIVFNGEDLSIAEESRMREIRGNCISMIFQEPLTSLNPVFKVGAQIAEPLQIHKNMRKKEALETAVALLRDVGIPSPEKRINDYPHQMSGGMRQRVMIAMALSCHPDLLIADEPTTALDVTVQSQMIDLLKRLSARRNMSLLLITHDLGVVAEMADHVAVMYAGKVMEYTNVQSLFQSPMNPYTVGLIESLPHFGRNRLKPIQGMVPAILDFPKGCKFNTRCKYAFENCYEKEPPLVNIAGPGSAVHMVRCWKSAANKI